MKGTTHFVPSTNLNLEKNKMATQFGTSVLTEIWKIINGTTNLVPGTN